MIFQSHLRQTQKILSAVFQFLGIGTVRLFKVDNPMLLFLAYQMPIAYTPKVNSLKYDQVKCCNFSFQQPFSEFEEVDLFVSFVLCLVLVMGIRFRDCRGLQFLLTTQMEELNKFQKLVREAVKNLEGPPSRNVIESATVCHLRPIRLPLNWQVLGESTG